MPYYLPDSWRPFPWLNQTQEERQRVLVPGPSEDLPLRRSLRCAQKENSGVAGTADQLPLVSHGHDFHGPKPLCSALDNKYPATMPQCMLANVMCYCLKLPCCLSPHPETISLDGQTLWTLLLIQCFSLGWVKCILLELGNGSST